MELYIHIPFCVRKCRYCDFLSFAGKEVCFREYSEALIRELYSYKELVCEKGLDTVFIGGGTPSLLPIEIMEPVLTAVDSLIEAGGGKVREYTIECNPGTITSEKLRMYKRHGINRLSIGLQSADDRELKLLGRIHDYDTFLSNYMLARSEGFDNINVDLISAVPGQKLSDWERTLRTVVGLGPEHISAYSLIIEEGTPFYDIYGDRNGSDNISGSPEKDITGERNADANFEDYPELPDEDTEREMYHLTEKVLKEYGYSRYEISNYSKTGFESKHNLGYWTGEEYIGAGLGASSYFMRDSGQAYRSVNTSDIDVYINNPYAEISYINEKDLIGEYIILHLRLTKGLFLKDFYNRFGIEIKSLFNKTIEKYIGLGLMEEEEGFLHLTSNGFDVSNTIMADFLPD